MNKIFMIGFLGGFSSILYCLIQNNKKENKHKIIYNDKIIFNDNKYKGEIKISSDKLIIYENPRPIYELYLKSDWEIL
jgi:hypothetical protein